MPDMSKVDSEKTKKTPKRKIILTLNNCLLPEEKLIKTPSQNDGLDAETEIDLRIWGCEIIQTAGILLKLPQVAMATAQVLFQRFYYCKSFARHSVETTAMACVCLASKIEEAPRRIRDVINVFNHIKQIMEQKPIKPVILDQNYINLKTQVIKSERRVLKELGFCVHVKHPHKIIVTYLQVLQYEHNAAIVQMAWNYMNDSLRTDVFVRYEPEVIACACIYLTARKMGIALPSNPKWYSLFGAKETDIKLICIKILQLYQRTKTNIEELEKKVEDVRRVYQEKKLKLRENDHKKSPQVKDSPNKSPAQPDGSHNAWGGFISRSGNHSVVELKRSVSPVKSKKRRSRSRSKHTSKKSRSPSEDREIKYRSKKHSRSRSRSVPNKKHKKNNHRSSSYEKSSKYDKHDDKYSKYDDKYSKYNEKYSKYDEKYSKYEKYRDSDKYKENSDKYKQNNDKYYSEKYSDYKSSKKVYDDESPEDDYVEVKSKSKKDKRR